MSATAGGQAGDPFVDAVSGDDLFQTVPDDRFTIRMVCGACRLADVVGSAANFTVLLEDTCERHRLVHARVALGVPVTGSLLELVRADAEDALNRLNHRIVFDSAGVATIGPGSDRLVTINLGPQGLMR